jgi:hypothetical protein
MVVNDPYWEFSSVFLLFQQAGQLLNRRKSNME